MKNLLLLTLLSFSALGCNMNPSKEARIQELEAKVETLETRIQKLENRNEQFNLKIEALEKAQSL